MYRKGREGASSPSPVYMDKHKMTNYLQDLRNNRPARPTGSRPPPAHFNTWSNRASARFADAPVAAASPPVKPEAAAPAAEQSKAHTRTSRMSIDGVLLASAGRPLVQPPRGRDMSTASTARDRTPSIQYREGGRRQSERLEARAVRLAMEEMDLKSEQNLYEAARDEAADLVWRHRNPDAPGASPSAPYPYPAAAQGSSERSRSVPRREQGEQGEQDLQRANSKLRKRHSMGSSGGSRSSSLQSRRSGSGSSVTMNAAFNDKGADASGPGSQHRRRNSGSRRKISPSLFKNPDDQIYEEPEEELPTPAPVPAPVPAPAPTTVANPPSPVKLPPGMRRNPFARVQFSRDNNNNNNNSNSNIVRANTDPVMATKRFDRYEIQRNPPSQSRNAAYTSNTERPTSSDDGKSDTENNAEAKLKDGKEVRSDELRAATGFKLKDRSAKLPTPTMVSDSPGRPIVSFKRDWRPKEIELKEEISMVPPSAPRPLSHAATAPTVPTIKTMEEPSRQTAAPPPAPVTHARATPSTPSPTRVNRAQMPAISVYEDPPARPLPNATTSRKVNTPPQTATPPVPTINVFQTPSAHSKPSPVPPIPSISVQETPSTSVSGPGRGSRVRAPSRGPDTNAPSISVTPSVPSISVNESPTRSRALPKIDAPSVSVSPSAPAINVNGSGSTRPLPNPKTASKSFGTRNTPTTNPRSHWTPTSVRTGALCEQCALPIAGRIVSAGGSRFHPECFRCHHCGEHLECVAFYPEPDSSRSARVARIRARLTGEDLEFLPSHPTLEDMQRLEAEDAHDESLRFYCHLDFHELFSPRCKSCKTPIEGEVVVACGAEWHPGHFFCAQCGDPFDSTTPFVEKEGYAWCVGCHTNRYSTKCRKCRRPVTETVVKALGFEWHVGCFCCVECSGPFDDGRYFLRGESQDPVCVRCEERRLKAY
ncbi:hypothetical protein P280DRAFT_529756 [Massarina eburnea CBS 473.64]|uniref:LIM zinc-binding domain-containing protein n=1 Tax=Massarina eburnea CBS 473.64 TaxID=1395130 RepID=A0A6A6RUK2_9PLEO|nr:hypothetical protein P280DRAFT_529756 [Massarina eburnea CBS 473.64]